MLFVIRWYYSELGVRTPRFRTSPPAHLGSWAERSIGLPHKIWSIDRYVPLRFSTFRCDGPTTFASASLLLLACSFRVRLRDQRAAPRMQPITPASLLDQPASLLDQAVGVPRRMVRGDECT